MKEDLRYLESLIGNQQHTSHPSDKDLANFIDNKLEKKEKEKIINHLIYCDNCSDIVANVIQYNRKSNVANNLLLKPILIAPLVALVASLIIFINFPSEIELGMIDLSKPSNMQYQGAKENGLVDKIIDADKILRIIEKSANLSHIESFNIAKEEERKKNFNRAKGLYNQALIQATKNLHTKERLQHKIIIHNRLLQLSNKEGLKASIKEYKDITRYEIRVYSLKYNKEEQ